MNNISIEFDHNMYLAVHAEEDARTPEIMVTLCDKDSASEPVKMDMYGLLKLRTFLSKLRGIKAMQTCSYSIPGGITATYKYLEDKDIHIGSTLAREPAIHMTSETAESLHKAINIVCDLIDRNRRGIITIHTQYKQHKRAGNNEIYRKKNRKEMAKRTPDFVVRAQKAEDEAYSVYKKVRSYEKDAEEYLEAAVAYAEAARIYAEDKYKAEAGRIYAEAKRKWEKAAAKHMEEKL
jgi:hypothetical protein